MANPPTRRTTPDDSPPYSAPDHYLDVDILVQMTTRGERRQPLRLKLKRLALRWATGEKKGEVATLKDVDPGQQHGELFFYIH